MNHGQSIGVNRPLRLFRYKVVHDAEKSSRQKEPDGVVPVPPLHHCVLNAGIQRVGLQE